jgi:hypothetical protein
MFSATISPLCYSFLGEWEASSGPIDYTRRNNVMRFALEQHARMPDFLRAPVTGFKRDFVRLFESLIRLGWFSYAG